jgi:hypothetical protein
MQLVIMLLVAGQRYCQPMFRMYTFYSKLSTTKVFSQFEHWGTIVH